MTADVKALYPNRYYASYDTKAPQPTIVLGWYDTWGMSSLAAVPPASQMVALTQDEWEGRLPIGHGVQNGRIVEYTAPPVMPPITLLAQNEMIWIGQEAATATAMGEVFSDTMKAYVKTIRAIVSGADTTTTELPERPTDILVSPSS